MAELFLGLFFLGLFVYVPIHFYRQNKRIEYAWNNDYYTLDQYLQEFPDCKTSRGIKCAKCGASSIKNWGIANVHDSRRLFICNHCGIVLYRSE